MDPPKNQNFEWLDLGCQSVLVSADIYQTNILTQFGGANPPEDPPK